MAFNPVDHGLFAVCSADLSVDLWRYNRRGNEMSKVSDRNDATPVGGVSQHFSVYDLAQLGHFLVDLTDASLSSLSDKLPRRSVAQRGQWLVF